MKLFEKIQSVSNEVRAVSKNITVGNGSYGYKAVGEYDVVTAVREAEKKYGLVSMATTELVSQDIIDVKRSNGKEGKDFVDTVKLTLEVVNVEDPKERHSVVAFGRGIDSGDKGLGKATTYARKYDMLNLYKIATGEDPDLQKSKDEERKKQEDEILVKVKNYLLENAEYAEQVRTHYNIESFDDLTKSQINSIYKSILKRQK